MSLTRLAAIVGALVAVIQEDTTTSQRTARGTLATIVSAMTTEGIKPRRSWSSATW